MFKKIQLIFTILLILFSSLNIGLPVVNNWKIFTEKFDPKLYEKKYNNSQYVIPQSKTPISDEELLAYAGYRYATGMNPVLINPDHPPLGKYIIGWVTLLTGNHRTVSLLFALGNIIILSTIVYYLTKSVTLVSIGVLFLTLDTMFIDQIIHSPILDIVQVFFLLLYFFIFIIWLKKPDLKKLILSGIILGCLASIKLYFPVFVVLAVCLVLLSLLKKSWKLVLTYLSLTALLGLITYMTTYWQFFMSGNSLRSFFGAQKWIFLFWKNNSVQGAKFIGDVFTLILANQWKVWWGDKPYIQFERWSPLWPIFFVTGILFSVYNLLNIKKLLTKNILTQTIMLFSLWTVFFTVYLALIPISPRYLLMLYFPIYILIAAVVKLKMKRYV